MRRDCFSWGCATPVEHGRILCRDHFAGLGQRERALLAAAHSMTGRERRRCAALLSAMGFALTPEEPKI